FYLFFCSTLFICLSIILYMFLIMTLCSHNKYYHSAYIRQFVSKSSYIDRSASANNSELNVKSLIENLKNVIMKKLSVLYIIRSFISLSALSISFSVTSSQSSTPVSVSDSLTLTTSVSVTSGFTVSAFVTSSLCFKKMLYRLNELHLSFLVGSVSEIILIKDDNTAETTLFYSQASSVTSSLSSAEKIVHTLS
ncbi:hypothetical protein BDFG_08995, partial [Blastomyces dermatitidis ATCC 26199]